jgi:hypothetical protein
MSKPNPKPSMITRAPAGWTNVDSSNVAALLPICISLIKNSSQINSGATFAATSVHDDVIKYNRSAFWLRADQQITIAFHSLDGPTRYHPERCPKFFVDVGISQKVFDGLPQPFDPKSVDYQSIRNGVIYFAQQNQSTARLYLWIEECGFPQAGDWIKPIFDYAIYKETEDSPAGVCEDYSNQKELFPTGDPRWCNKMRTWKLSCCPCA